jgi:hypothetical protein
MFFFNGKIYLGEWCESIYKQKECTEMHRLKHIVIEKTNSSSVFFSQVFIDLQPQIAKPLYDCAFKIFHVDDQWSIDKFIYLSHRLAPNFFQTAQS